MLVIWQNHWGKEGVRDVLVLWCQNTALAQHNFACPSSCCDDHPKDLVFTTAQSLVKPFWQEKKDTSHVSITFNYPSAKLIYYFNIPHHFLRLSCYILFKHWFMSDQSSKFQPSNPNFFSVGEYTFSPFRPLTIVKPHSVSLDSLSSLSSGQKIHNLVSFWCSLHSKIFFYQIDERCFYLPWSSRIFAFFTNGLDSLPPESLVVIICICLLTN